MNKRIKDIRYSASKCPNKSGNSLPGSAFFKELIHADCTKYSAIIARKLNEFNFLSGEYDHIDINYSTALEKDKIILSDRKTEKWMQYIDYGIDENQIKAFNDDEAFRFIQKTTFLSLFELYKNDKEKIEMLQKVKEELDKEGDLIKIKYKSKETKKWKIDIYYQIKPDGIKETKCLIEYMDSNGKYFVKELYFPYYEDIYAFIDTITVKDNTIILRPKKSFKASLYQRNSNHYETPIRIKIE